MVVVDFVVMFFLRALFAEIGVGASPMYDAPPLFNISATSHYDAGLQHGRLAASRIKAWFSSTAEMRNLRRFIRGPGRADFERLKADNARLYPRYADEIRGISEGSGVPLDMVWAVNMINELESLAQEKEKGEHCTDVFAVPDGGFGQGFTHGHNEDWGDNKFWYFVRYTATPGGDYPSCAGMCYPGGMVGWSPAWNPYGMYLTQNTLSPLNTRPHGLASMFAQREAICGPSGSRGLDAVVAKLTEQGWSSGASVNLVDINARRMANVEVDKDEHSVFEVKGPSVGLAANATHFNSYKHLKTPQTESTSTEVRQARADSLPAPRKQSDVMELLSDTLNTPNRIFNQNTLSTMVLDGPSGNLNVWCCGISPKAGPPVYRWNLRHFFDDKGQAAPQRSLSDQALTQKTMLV